MASSLPIFSSTYRAGLLRDNPEFVGVVAEHIGPDYDFGRLESLTVKDVVRKVERIRPAIFECVEAALEETADAGEKDRLKTSLAGETTYVACIHLAASCLKDPELPILRCSTKVITAIGDFCTRETLGGLLPAVATDLRQLTVTLVAKAASSARSRAVYFAEYGCMPHTPPRTSQYVRLMETYRACNHARQMLERNGPNSVDLRLTCYDTTGRNTGTKSTSFDREWEVSAQPEGSAAGVMGALFGAASSSRHRNRIIDAGQNVCRALVALHSDDDRKAQIAELKRRHDLLECQARAVGIELAVPAERLAELERSREFSVDVELIKTRMALGLDGVDASSNLIPGIPPQRLFERLIGHDGLLCRDSITSGVTVSRPEHERFVVSLIRTLGRICVSAEEVTILDMLAEHTQKHAGDTRRLLGSLRVLSTYDPTMGLRDDESGALVVFWDVASHFAAERGWFGVDVMPASLDHLGTPTEAPSAAPSPSAPPPIEDDDHIEEKVQRPALGYQSIFGIRMTGSDPEENTITLTAFMVGTNQRRYRIEVCIEGSPEGFRSMTREDMQELKQRILDRARAQTSGDSPTVAAAAGGGGDPFAEVFPTEDVDRVRPRVAAMSDIDKRLIQAGVLSPTRSLRDLARRIISEGLERVIEEIAISTSASERPSVCIRLIQAAILARAPEVTSTSTTHIQATAKWILRKVQTLRSSHFTKGDLLLVTSLLRQDNVREASAGLSDNQVAARDDAVTSLLGRLDGLYASSRAGSLAATGKPIAV